MGKTKQKVLKKKRMCLTPVDDSVELQFRALAALNSFKALGFETWSAFYALMEENYPDASTIDVYKKLQAFWNLRNFHREIIERLEMIVESVMKE